VDQSPNRTVRFRVGDVVHPRPVQVLLDMFRHLSLEGEVVTTTSDGELPYLVVRVAGLAEAVIVPLAKTTPFFDEDGAPILAEAGLGN
jgi:hypothetical protein